MASRPRYRELVFFGASVRTCLENPQLGILPMKSRKETVRELKRIIPRALLQGAVIWSALGLLEWIRNLT
jgi:preprotein translocase subunit SecY